MPQTQSPEKKLLVGFFLTSLLMLTFELLVSRAMSAVLLYHFAFLAVCLALFGITVGAVIVHMFNKFLSRHFTGALCVASVLFSVTVLINLLCISQLRALSFSDEWQMILNYKNLTVILISIVLPLIASGVCMSLIFERYAKRANKIYFINLIGASLGCLLFIPLINLLEVTNSYIFLALGGLLAAYLFNPKSSNLKKILAVFSFLIIFTAFMNTQKGFLELQWIKGKTNEGYYYKKWNSFSYVRLEHIKLKQPKGWSFGPKKFNELSKMYIEQRALDIDGGAGAFMTNFEHRDVNSINFLKYDVTSLPYHLINNGDALVIGVGAGRDILTGIITNQRSITGVEINETILNIHRTISSKFNGDLSRHPKVTFINNEARSFINSSKKKFDIIQISLIDTFAAAQAGAYALSENNLYTTEAIQTYWEHLTDQGMLSISYWSHPFMLKIIGAATMALDASGIQHPRPYFVMVHSVHPKIFTGVDTFLVKKTPFTDQELTAIKNFCDEMGFFLVLSPDETPHESLNQVSNIRSLDSYVQGSAINIAPATDDKPFFFLTTKFNFLKSLKEFKIFSLQAEGILISLLIIMLALTICFVLLPLTHLSINNLSGIPVFSCSLYFIAIGIAFMFVELSQVTRLSSFLGHPVYSLALVLFSFLFGSGLGSYFLGAIHDNKKLIMASSLFILFCLFSTIFTTPVLYYFSKYAIPIRMIISVVLLFPLAFFMGMFLPQGIKILGHRDGPVALFWGLNGAASVLGSILSMIFQIQYGLKTTFFWGVVLYGLAIMLLIYLKSREWIKE